MERRVLLAVFLSFLVLVLYQRWVGPPPVPVDRVGTDPAATAASPPGATDTQTAIGPARAAGAIGMPAVDGSAPPPAVVDVEFELEVADDGPRDIVVESEFVRAVFANRGAKLVSWQIKGHVDDNGGPVELVPPEVSPDQAWPFSLRVPDDPGISVRLKDALFRPSRRPASVGGRPGDARLRVRR